MHCEIPEYIELDKNNLLNKEQESWCLTNTAVAVFFVKQESAAVVVDVRHSTAIK